MLPGLAPGSTVRLSAGEHRLRDTVVVLRGITIVGAGRGRTTLTSDAPDAALLALTPDRIDLRDLALRHVGDEAASLIVGSSTTTLALERVELSGARAVARGGTEQRRTPASGGSAVLMAGEDGSGERETTLEVTDSVFRDNQASGILLGGSHVASVVDSRFVASGQCGICFTGSSSGEVRSSRFRAASPASSPPGAPRPCSAAARPGSGDRGAGRRPRLPVVRSTTIADTAAPRCCSATGAAAGSSRSPARAPVRPGGRQASAAVHRAHRLPGAADGLTAHQWAGGDPCRPGVTDAVERCLTMVRAPPLRAARADPPAWTSPRRPAPARETTRRTASWRAGRGRR